MPEMIDEYVNKYIVAIKKCKSDKELKDVINKLYSEGFCEGVDEGQEPSVPDEPIRNEGYD